ncbi:MAG: rhomboid family intramembrane serine protease [Chitinophagales bacterium]|nr:rhomboid family intramembrane serine protease [Chitinophagales bacterium]
MLRRAFPNITNVVKYIVLINILVFLVGMYFESTQQMDLASLGGLHYYALPGFQWFQIFTCIFLHGGFMHLLMNMITLISLGSALEQMYGPKRFLIFYLLCGIFSSIISLIFQGVDVYTYTGSYFPAITDLLEIPPKVLSISVGASGAIYGVFTAIAMTNPNASFFIFFIPFPIKAKNLLIGLICLEFYLGVSHFEWDFFGHWAHLGGAATGMVLASIFSRRRF